MSDFHWRMMKASFAGNVSLWKWRRGHDFNRWGLRICEARQFFRRRWSNSVAKPAAD